MTQLLAVNGLVVRYPTARDWLGRPTVYHEALSGISFEVARGECVGIVGESGSGKSTIANVVMGLVEPDAGDVRFDGAILPPARQRDRELSARIQVVFQDPQSSLDPRVAAWATITEGLAVRGERNRSTLLRRAGELAATVGLDPATLSRRPHAFSGGQRQRIAIARALALDPQLLVLDEPTSALDVSAQATVLNLLLDLQTEFGLTYVLISHDMSVIAHLCHRVVVMRNGVVVESGPTARVLRAPEHAYTRSLIAAIPIVGDALTA